MASDANRDKQMSLTVQL